MYTRKITAVLGCAFLCLGSGLACAGTIDFNVPLDVKSYPVPNGRVDVWCELSNSQGQGIQANYVSLKLIGGTLSGFTHVKVNYLPEEAANIKNYRCALVAESKSMSSGLSTAKAIPVGATILSHVGGPLK
jgi:hypothetical protein